jgi:hypothetical protein
VDRRRRGTGPHHRFRRQALRPRRLCSSSPLSLSRNTHVGLLRLTPLQRGASTSSGATICSRGHLHCVSSPRRSHRVQVFYTDVAKLDQDIIYVAMVCTRMLQVFIFNVLSVFFRRMSQVCLSRCCICFTLDIASVLSRRSVCLQ